MEKVSARVAISIQLEHRADARRRADDGEHENGEAAFVLKQILPVDVGDACYGRSSKRRG